MTGYKEWSIGEVVEAGDFQTYIQNQTVMKFADSASRTSEIGASVTEGMLSYLVSTGTLQYYTGAVWADVSSVGDITAVTAGTALTGGGTSGSVTLNVNLASVASSVLANPTITGTATLPSTTSIGNVSSAEIGFVDGVTSSIQSQLNSKQAILTGLTSTVAQLNFSNTVTSNLQTQLDAKVSTTNGAVTTAATGSNVVRNITLSTSAPTGGADGDVWLVYTP